MLSTLRVASKVLCNNLKGCRYVIFFELPKARYKGTRKNTFDLRIVCAIQNLERAQAFEMPRVLEEAA